jgi:competence protein ComFB
MDEVILVNRMESVVQEALEEVIAKGEIAVCSCERCRLDVLALALNCLSPKYVVTEIGNAVTNVDLDSFQGKANVTMAVYKAIGVVTGRPRHQ